MSFEGGKFRILFRVAGQISRNSTESPESTLTLLMPPRPRSGSPPLPPPGFLALENTGDSSRAVWRAWVCDFCPFNSDPQFIGYL